MKPRTKSDFGSIEAHVRHAKAERAAYLGELIGSGLFVLSRIVARPFAIARSWRGKQRLAPR